AWKASRRADGDYSTTLFEEERMKMRCDIFIDLAAPIYQTWADQYEYRHVVHFSSDLPDQWLDRLEDAARRHPFIVLDEVTEAVRTQSVITSDLRTHGHGAGVVVRLRIDDDDLLAADYLS